MIVTLTVLCVILLIILFIMLLRVKIVIEAADSVAVYLKVLFFKIPLVPSKQKKVKLGEWSAKKYRRKKEKEKLKELKKQQKKARADQKKKAKKEKTKNLAKAKPKPKKSVSDIVDLVGLISKLVGTFFVRFSKRLRLDITKIHIVVGGEDAAATAISYGAICQGVSCLLSALDTITNVSPKNDRDITVDASFLTDKTEVDIKLAASLRVWHVFDILLSVAVKFIKEKYLKNYKI